jgi:hypothetical protein
MPFVKTIHPDFFALEVLKVQQSNQICLQHLNDFVESVESLQVKLNSRSTLVEVAKPFAKSYSFKCYVRAGNDLSKQNSGGVQRREVPLNRDKNEPEKLRTIEMKITTPESLVSRKILPATRIRSDMSDLLSNFGQLFAEAGIENPWKRMDSDAGDGATGTNSSSSSLSPGSEGFKKFEGVIDRRIFDASVRRRAMSRQSSPTISKSGRLARSTIADEVEFFIRKGHILLRGFSSPVEEYESVQKFRQFLVDYGSNIYFDVSRWQSVVFILYDELPPNLYGIHRCDAESSTSSHHHSADGSKADNSATRYSTLKYIVTPREDGKIIAYIPHNFKSGALLDFITDNIPAASALYGLDTIGNGTSTDDLI